MYCCRLWRSFVPVVVMGLSVAALPGSARGEEVHTLTSPENGTVQELAQALAQVSDNSSSGDDRTEQPRSERPTVAVLDVTSDSFTESELRLFTDILRTEIFKLGRFDIVERGLIQQVIEEQQLGAIDALEDAELLELGEQLAAEKILSARIEELAETTALNVRMIDVESSILDFTENVFVSDRGDVFDAIRDLVVNVDVHYVDDDEADPESRQQAQTQRWMRLGASSEEADELVGRDAEIDEYLSIRQYDVTFGPGDYIDLLDAGWEATTVIEFFRLGVPYDQVERALEHGISGVDTYAREFQPEGISFEGYLEAYERQLLTAEDYLEYRDGYNRLRYVFGAGGVANALPIANADFRFFVLTAGAEYFVTPYQRGFFKASAEAGFNFMNVILPSPYLQFNVYAGTEPFYLKAGVGGLAEVFLGGHFAAYGRAGLELNEVLEFNLFVGFAGTQPEVSYTDLETARGEEDYVGIDFPYMGAVLAFKPSQLVPFRY